LDLKEDVAVRYRNVSTSWYFHLPSNMFAIDPHILSFSRGL